MDTSSGLSRSARTRQWLERVDLTLRSQGLARAAPLALQAVEDGIEHPFLLNLAASVRHGEGRFDDAVDLLNRARSLTPKDANILNSLGICLRALGQTYPALEAYGAALKIDPGMAAAHYNRGALLESLNDLTGARAAYERAAALKPDYVEPVASLAWLDAQAGDPVSARAKAEQVLSVSRSNILARMALASAGLQERNLAAATGLLGALVHDPAIGEVNRSIVLGMIGDLLDAEGRPADAYAAYAASNAEMKTLNAGLYEGPGKETAIEHARRLTAWFEPSDSAPWRDSPPLRPRAADPRAHVFLVGFPRSGTTLLENVLAAHPDIVSLEEKDSLESVSGAYLGSNDGLQRLAQLSSREAARHRDAYWSFVRSFGVEPRGKVFIDKMPLVSVALPVVAKLFPNARILFALRDPRDVVLSCFRRRFGMNPSMYQLLTLDGAAAYYDAVMRLSEMFRNLLPLPQQIVRYESLVEDFEGTARAACEFVGVDWNENVVNFAAKARTRGISTPSASQVARGLNREGQGAWRRYREQMEPVLPILEPWVERFGYEL